MRSRMESRMVFWYKIARENSHEISHINSYELSQEILHKGCPFPLLSEKTLFQDHPRIIMTIPTTKIYNNEKFYHFVALYNFQRSIE